MQKTGRKTLQLTMIVPILYFRRRPVNLLKRIMHGLIGMQKKRHGAES